MNDKVRTAQEHEDFRDDFNRDSSPGAIDADFLNEGVDVVALGGETACCNCCYCMGESIEGCDTDTDIKDTAKKDIS